MVNHRLFGDESDLHFWTVASHYLQSFAQARQLSVSTADGQAQSEGTQPAAQNHLDICHDVLCESSYFQVSRWRPRSNHISLFTPPPSFDTTSRTLWRGNAVLTYAKMLDKVYSRNIYKVGRLSFLLIAAKISAFYQYVCLFVFWVWAFMEKRNITHKMT